MASPTQDRPRQVTVGALVSGAASLAMLLSVGSLLARWHTVDLRQAVEEFLSRGSGRTLNIGVDQALSLARAGLMVLGAVSAAILVFAFFAARRDKGARIAMTVLAVPLVVCGLWVDFFLTGFIVAATVMLWSAPARDWYAGRTPRPPAPQTPSLGPGTPDSQFSSAAPSAVADQGSPASPLGQTPPPYVGSYGDPGLSGAPTLQARPAGRPRQVSAACLTTWVFAALVSVLMVIAVASLGSAQVRRQFRQALADNPQAGELGITVHQLQVASAVVCLLLVVWAGLAALVAVLVWRRRAWARVVLVVSAVGAGGLALLCSVAFPGFLIIAIACGGSVAMLLHRDTTAWLQRSNRT
ncbi:hypothetical protein D9V37_17045 [Nocardioides mangrovicus]|uniref:DUF4064 domain-containing protein n=1 Tax=Nocardioides mangrovicus TaxID=2478913 RepID=A0A3L8NZU7_9ACTN|nr:hypothetical protein [Nocardioides mangrovicus]RLV47829.1 hypothetical protein D9V37_17045 [Nocardioides mangrovicus]